MNYRVSVFEQNINITDDLENEYQAFRNQFDVDHSVNTNSS